MEKHLIVIGIVVLLLSIGLSGCVEPFQNNNEINDEEAPIPGIEWFQTGNAQTMTQLQPKRSNELDDNRIGGLWSGLWQPFGYEEILNNEILGMGLKRNRVAINSIDVCSANWTSPEFSIDPSHDDWITRMAEGGVTITYVLSFWDKAGWAEGKWGFWNKTEDYSRFKTEEEIQRYLDYVQFIVHHFKDRVQYFEIWNEPNLGGKDYGQYIEVEDYVNLVKRVVPVIHQEYPEARIGVGSVCPLFEPSSYDYLSGILESDAMPLVDAISWHVGGPSPDYELFGEYYYNYPSLVQEIKDVASAHGFEGEYIADELNWRSPLTPHSSEPGVYSQIACAKYYARGIVMHLGMDVTVGLAGVSEYRPIFYGTVKNLCTIVAGAKSINLPFEIESDATNIQNFSFSLSNGDVLVALWTDGVAIDEDLGVNTNLTLHSFTALEVTGIDVLEGFQQRLVTSNENGNLVIQNLIVRDYPLILYIVKSV